jgi:hypothetical protein
MLVLGQKARSERALRTQAEQAEGIAEKARLVNLRSTAVFAANTYGYEIDQRWWMLSESAADAELHELLKAASGKEPDSPEQARLQTWLAKRSSSLLAQGKADSWFVNDATGTQMARNPWGDSIGKSYRHRSYFHGGQRDASPEEAQELSPIRRPNLSAVYESTATHELKVSFTVPIWDDGGGESDEPIGVLGMSVRLGDFVQLAAEMENTTILLVDLRTDWLEGEPKTGLVLDCPNLDAARQARAAATGNTLLRLDPNQIDELAQYRTQQRKRRTWKSDATGRPAGLEGLDRSFQDPAVEAGAGTCVAAYEPVFVPGREGELEDTGWMVIIEDRAGVEPVAVEPDGAEEGR